MRLILEIIIDEKEKATRKYLEMVFEDSFKKGNDNNDKLDYEFVSPIKKLFKDYLKDLIIFYEKKYIENMEKFATKKQKYKEKLMMELDNKEGNPEKFEKIKNEIEVFSKKLDEQRECINRFLLENLEKSLGNAAPAPDLLEITCSVRIPAKNINIEKYLINPITQIKDFQQFIYEYSIKLNNPIVNINQPNSYIKHSSEFSKNMNKFINLEGKELKKGIFSEVSKINQDEIKICTFDSDDIMANKSLKQGCQIYIFGDIKFKSDSPPECITYNFQKDQIIDYFSCSICKINWVCSNCKDFCHKDHNTVVYLKEHKATWACCYCVSRGFCKYLNVILLILGL